MTPQPPSTQSGTECDSESVAWCFEHDGLLQAVRIMAEHKTKKVMVLNAERSMIGWFELWKSRIVFRPRKDSSVNA